MASWVPQDPLSFLCAVTRTSRQRLHVVRVRKRGTIDNADNERSVLERFGRYEILEVLGGDDVSEVLECSGPSPGGERRPVVLWRMRKGLAEHPSLARLYLAEARLAQRLVHPNIARVLEVDELEGAPYMAVEHVSGPTLAEVIFQSWRLDRPCMLIVAKILEEIALALAHAHLACDERGRPLHIVHRQVTPWNIVLSPEGAPKLLDFGVVRLPGPLGHDARRTGGRQWHLAPERFSGAREDGRSDVFSVGAGLLLAATGQSPSAAPLPARLSPLVEPELEALIVQAMDPRIEQRPTALALSRALQAHASRRVDRVTLPMVGAFVRALFEPAPPVAPARAEDEALRRLLFPVTDQEETADAVAGGVTEASFPRPFTAPLGRRSLASMSVAT